MRLIIVGNGFDLHHGLKTGPKDYCDFLNDNYPTIMEKLSQNWYFKGKVFKEKKEDGCKYIYWSGYGGSFIAEV